MTTEVAIKLGSLIELKRGEAAILGRFDVYTFYGWPCGPALLMDPSIGHGYNVEKMIEQGWELTIVSEPPRP